MKRQTLSKVALISSMITLSLFGAKMSMAETSPSLSEAQSNWAKCNYTKWTVDSGKGICLEKAITELESTMSNQSDDAALKIWLAIDKATLAGEKGGLTGLGLAKEAKALLEDVIATAPNTLEGSAYTSLGSLYYKVPGWPVGFGDEDQAKMYLQKALEINPDGIDSNYFYADFLIETGKASEAQPYLEKAQHAAPRIGRETADAGRQQEIQQLLEKIKSLN